AECYLVKRGKDYLVPLAEGADPNEWVMHEKEQVAGWYLHLLVQRRPGCAGFFQYTPEVMLSFLLDPTVVDLCNNRIEGPSNTADVKARIYGDYFLLEPRPKYTGFENV